MQYVTDPQYLRKNEVSTETRWLRQREASIDSGAGAPKPRADYRKPQALQVVSLKVFKIGQMLLVSYGIDFSL